MAIITLQHLVMQPPVAGNAFSAKNGGRAHPVGEFSARLFEDHQQRERNSTATTREWQSQA